MYVVCAWSPTIRVYDTNTYSPRYRSINVHGMRNPHDMVICRVDHQLYVADWDRIWRVSADQLEFMKWLPNGESAQHSFNAYSLSVTSRRLLVTSWRHRKLELYSAERQLLHAIEFPTNMHRLYHAVETHRNTFVLGYIDASKRGAVSDAFSAHLTMLSVCLSVVYLSHS